MLKILLSITILKQMNKKGLEHSCANPFLLYHKTS